MHVIDILSNDNSLTYCLFTLAVLAVSYTMFGSKKWDPRDKVPAESLVLVLSIGSCVEIV